MPFQLEGTSATHTAPFGSVPVKWALDADADEPVPATSVTTRTTTRSVLRSQMRRRFTVDLPLLVPAFRTALPAPADDRGSIEDFRLPVNHPEIHALSSGCGAGQSLEWAEVDASLEDLPRRALRELRDEHDVARVL